MIADVIDLPHKQPALLTLSSAPNSPIAGLTLEKLRLMPFTETPKATSATCPTSCRCHRPASWRPSLLTISAQTPPDAMLTLDFQRTASQCAILSDVLGLLLKAHTILSPYFLRMSSVCVW